MEDVIIIIVCLWGLCALLSLLFYTNKKEDVDWTVIALFPANLIYVLKIFWKSIIKAIKS